MRNEVQEKHHFAHPFLFAKNSWQKIQKKIRKMESENNVCKNGARVRPIPGSNPMDLGPMLRKTFPSDVILYLLITLSKRGRL